MERLTYRDSSGRALLTLYGKQVYCSTQATADCFCKLEENALSLLKAQEPRVMTWEEWWNAPEPLDGECMCYEIKDEGLAAVLVKAFKGCKEFYGKEFRCWTSRPTDEQRKAVKWDD